MGTVLPSLRKHGGYIAGQEILTNEQVLAKAVLVAQSVIAEKDARISKLEPAAAVAETTFVLGKRRATGGLVEGLKPSDQEGRPLTLFAEVSFPQHS